MTRPNFLFIGPSKTASSWLQAVLTAHDRVYIPPAKDIYFFDRYFDRGLDWYLGFFKEAPDSAIAVGEISHDYIHDPAAAARIHDALPDCRIIATLRHPLDRAVSEYRYMYQAGWVGRDFDAALAAQPSILGNSRYARDLPVWLETFPRDRLLIQNYDALRADPHAFADEILDFLGLPRQQGLPVDDRVRAAGTARNRLVARLVKAGAMAARELGLATLVGRIKTDPRVRRLLYRDFKDGEKPGPTRAQAAALVADFEPDIAYAEEVFGTLLPGWREVKETVLAQGEGIGS
ncbi:MAG: sulfotransferase domain-containing protein [Alphaproteobacteria bacterium]|nr:sulfotransferase domain-containing protein [Alphaproteobacteria bacterium]